VGAYASAVRTVVTNGLVLDTATMSFRGEAAVVIEDGVIVDVLDRYAGTADAEVECSWLLRPPGLIDAHVHLRIASMDFRAMQSWTEVEIRHPHGDPGPPHGGAGVHDRARSGR